MCIPVNVGLKLQTTKKTSCTIFDMCEWNYCLLSLCMTSCILRSCTPGRNSTRSKLCSGLVCPWMSTSNYSVSIMTFFAHALNKKFPFLIHCFFDFFFFFLICSFLFGWFIFFFSFCLLVHILNIVLILFFSLVFLSFFLPWFLDFERTVCFEENDLTVIIHFFSVTHAGTHARRSLSLS